MEECGLLLVQREKENLTFFPASFWSQLISLMTHSEGSSASESLLSVVLQLNGGHLVDWLAVLLMTVMECGLNCFL